MFEGDAYHTGPEKGWALLRAFPSFFFYCQDSVIVLKASWRAKHGRYDTAAWVASSRKVLRALESVGVKFEITGVDNIRKLDAPGVFIGNHMSILETFVLPAIIAPFRDTTFVVKQSLVEYPVFKHVMRSRNPVTVTRTNPREDLRAILEGGEQRLKAGISIVIFPQTTRTTVFDPTDFNSIGVKLAKKAGAPIVPIALKTDAWGNGRYLKDFGRIGPASKVHFAFGEPLWVKDRGREEHEQIVRFISDKLTEWST
ncbi:MAG: lysophospholipid acyltransferase family protein [Planctomycetota bacterium]|nr:lysophospholipid acyltransferase family protein [Planctomycetota bacterium]